MDGFHAADTMTDETWEKVMGINLTVPTKLIRAVLPFMKARKNGSIINIGSKAGASGASAGLAYTTSKHALVSSHKLFILRNETDIGTFLAWSHETYSLAFQKRWNSMQCCTPRW
jgi:NAD(P)-dependent dehydrogenase (short-subunit alcohol dehydrogenase family)